MGLSYGIGKVWRERSCREGMGPEKDSHRPAKKLGVIGIKGETKSAEASLPCKRG